MRRRYKILLWLGGLMSVAVAALGVTLSHESPCAERPPIASEGPLMQAIVYRCYGGPEVLALEQIARPQPDDDQLLVKVRAAGVNPLDWHYLRGEPYIMRMSSGIGAPTESRLGVDYAGVVEAVGKNVTTFKPGDEVFGGRTGAFADYIVVRADRSVVHKPANVSFEQAAAVPIAAITALQGLRDKGQLKAGQKVLINGASGGVGSYAVQIAKSFGAEVTGVCSTRNLELVRGIGASHVIDYTREDFTAGETRYDLIVDNVGNRSLGELRQVLTPKGRLVIIGGPSSEPFLGPMIQPLKAALLSPFVSQDLSMLMAELNPADLKILADMLENGTLTSVIDRQYTLAQVPEAIAYLETGRARGKVVISMGGG